MSSIRDKVLMGLIFAGIKFLGFRVFWPFREIKSPAKFLNSAQPRN